MIKHLTIHSRSCKNWQSLIRIELRAYGMSEDSLQPKQPECLLKSVETVNPPSRQNTNFRLTSYSRPSSNNFFAISLELKLEWRVDIRRVHLQTFTIQLPNIEEHSI